MYMSKGVRLGDLAETWRHAHFPAEDIIAWHMIPTGNDRKTLVRELLAYSDPKRTFPLITADASQPEDLKELKAVGVDMPLRDSLLIITVPPGEKELVGVEFPLTTSHVVIDDCVDLRQRETQDWFFEKFRLGDGEVLEMPLGGNIRKFTDMLPALMWPSLGGGGIDEHGFITRAIGTWMRKNLVSALVFPSARADPFVRYRKSQLIDFYGWNLVDYRGAWEGADEGAKRMKIFHQSPWPRALPYEATMKANWSGSWHLVGPEAYLRSRIGLK